MPKNKFVDQQVVTEFAEFRALKNKIEKWLKAEREELLELFQKGFLCPIDGPFILIPEPASRSNVDWKEEIFKQLKKQFKAEGHKGKIAKQLALDAMERMEQRAGRSSYYELAVKPNPNYAGEAQRAIVKKLDSRSERGF